MGFGFLPAECERENVLEAAASVQRTAVSVEHGCPNFARHSTTTIFVGSLVVLA
jgi:hypothetical protein